MKFPPNPSTALGALAVLAALAAPARADFQASDLGTSSGQFLRLPVGARGIAMGEALSTLADDGTAPYWNPAALVQVDGRALTLMHGLYIQQIYYDYLGYAQRVGDQFAYGISAQYVNGGPVAQTDANGAELGYFQPHDVAVAASIASEVTGSEAGPLEGLAVGVSGKYLRSQLLDYAETGALDVGLLSPRYFDDRLRLSAVAQNLLGRLRFGTDEEPLPVVYRAGGALTLGALSLAAEGVMPRDGAAYAAAGVEFVLYPDEDRRRGLALRAGWNGRSADGLDQRMAGISFGGGYAGRTLRVDYALTPFGKLGDSHRLSITLKF